MVAHRSSRTQADAQTDYVSSVLLPLPLKGAYDYRLEMDNDAEPGAFVTVPLGNRTIIGVIWGEAEGGVEEAKLRSVSSILDAPPLSEVSRRFVDWVARYTLSWPGSVLRMVMNMPEALEPPKPMIAYARTTLDPEDAGLRMTPARRRVLSVLDDGPPRLAAELAREAGVTTGVVSGLTKAGVLEPIPMRKPMPPQPDPAASGPTLSPEQSVAAEALRKAIANGGFDATLLETLRAGLALGVLAAAAYLVMAEPVVALLYQGGRFGPEQTAGVATLLRIFAWAVPAWIVQQITVRGFYAREDMWRPMLLGTSIALAVIPLYWQLGASFGAAGLAAAGSIGMTANAVATLCLLRWLYGAPDLGVLAASGLRAALAGAVAGGAVLLVPDTGVGGLAGRFVDLALPAAVFGGVGIAAVYAVGDAPLRAALDRMLRRLRRGSG